MSNNSAVIIADLKKMETASRNLQQALIRRDPKAIWEATEKLEYILGKLETAKINNETDDKKEVKALAGKIKRLHRTTYKMASSFVNVVNQTLVDLTSKNNKATSTYKSTGQINSTVTPVLIHQKG
jgi:hypothetical protein